MYIEYLLFATSHRLLAITEVPIYENEELDVKSLIIRDIHLMNKVYTDRTLNNNDFITGLTWLS